MSNPYYIPRDSSGAQNLLTAADIATRLYGIRQSGKIAEQRTQIEKGALDVSRNRNQLESHRLEMMYGPRGVETERNVLMERRLKIDEGAQTASAKQFEASHAMKFNALLIQGANNQGIDPKMITKAWEPITKTMENWASDPKVTRGEAYDRAKASKTVFYETVKKNLQKEVDKLITDNMGHITPQAAALMDRIDALEEDTEGAAIDAMFPSVSRERQNQQAEKSGKLSSQPYETWETPDGKTINLRRGEMPPAGAVPYSAKTPKGGNLNFKDVVDLQKKFNEVPEVKEYITVTTQMKRAEQAIQQARIGKGSMNAVDQSLITLLNKILDPTSVVRESEYARTPEGMSVMERLKGYAGRLEKGGAGLSPNEREALYTMINKFYGVSEEMYNKQVEYYTDLAKRYEENPQDVIRLGGKAQSLTTMPTVQEMSDEELLEKLSK